MNKQVTAPSINAVSSPGPPVLAALVLAVAGALGWAILSLPPEAPGLTRNVLSALPDSGVGNPVTAVLLNFRAYDTLLEVGVLMLAAAAVFALDRRPAEPAPPLSFSMLPVLLRLLIPLMIVVAGYLLWRGADAPGGAFQAGAVLGAAGVLMAVAGAPLPGFADRGGMRALLCAGLAVFLLTGLGMMLLGGALLQYPPGAAKALILLIETAATGSIAAILLALFVGR